MKNTTYVLCATCANPLPMRVRGIPFDNCFYCGGSNGKEKRTEATLSGCASTFQSETQTRNEKEIGESNDNQDRDKTPVAKKAQEER